MSDDVNWSKYTGVRPWAFTQRPIKEIIAEKEAAHLKEMRSGAQEHKTGFMSLERSPEVQQRQAEHDKLVKKACDTVLRTIEAATPPLGLGLTLNGFLEYKGPDWAKGLDDVKVGEVVSFLDPTWVWAGKPAFGLQGQVVCAHNGAVRGADVHIPDLNDTLFFPHSWWLTKMFPTQRGLKPRTYMRVAHTWGYGQAVQISKLSHSMDDDAKRLWFEKLDDGSTKILFIEDPHWLKNVWPIR